MFTMEASTSFTDPSRLTWLPQESLGGFTPVTSCESNPTRMIGTAKATTTTMASCLGVLMNEECSSLIKEIRKRGRGRVAKRAL